MTRTDTGRPDELADRVAAAATSVPGVTGLHAGSFGEVGTYLPGRRVAGVRLGGTTQVHVTVAMGSRLLDVADAVALLVTPLVGGPVEVVIEDVTAPGADTGAVP